MEQVITSILDSDLYKFTMQQAVLKLFPNAIVAYKFKNRGKQRFTPEFLDELRRQITYMASITLADVEYSAISLNIPFFEPTYIEYLRNYRFNPDEVKVDLDADNNLVIDIEGPWHTTILWEVPLMALISELYFKMIDTDWGDELTADFVVFPNDKWVDGGWNPKCQRERAFLKIREMQKAGAYFVDFGTRRRRSKHNQEVAILAFLDYQKDYKKESPGGLILPFVGTSNVYFAMKYGIKPIGTMAHEWFMGISVLRSLRNCNFYSLQSWLKVYDGELGIALTDTFGTPAFFGDFGMRLAKLYDGVRHDSGDPFEFTDKVIAHYKELGIDLLSKTIVFSDGLDIATAIKIKAYCEGKIKCAFGIGTHITNDFDNSKALNMVIKLWSCAGVPVVKLSDTPGKVMGDKDAVRVAQWTFNKTPLEWKQK